MRSLAHVFPYFYVKGELQFSYKVTRRNRVLKPEYMFTKIASFVIAECAHRTFGKLIGPWGQSTLEIDGGDGSLPQGIT